VTSYLAFLNCERADGWLINFLFDCVGLKVVPVSFYFELLTQNAEELRSSCSRSAALAHDFDGGSLGRCRKDEDK
jgi:hypothetical protein